MYFLFIVVCILEVFIYTGIFHFVREGDHGNTLLWCFYGALNTLNVSLYYNLLR